jgi:hypothetical protein
VLRSLTGTDSVDEKLVTRHDFPCQELSSIGLFPRNVCGCRQLWRLVRRRYCVVVKLDSTRNVDQGAFNQEGKQFHVKRESGDERSVEVIFLGTRL